MRLRPATRHDIPALAELLLAGHRSHRAWAGPDMRMPSLEETALGWDLRFARRGAWIGLAEDETGRPPAGVVAFAGATIARDDPRPVDGLGHVSALFVAPDRWRQGIAHRLLAAAEAAMRAAGYEQAQLWTLLGSPAEVFYTAEGWRPDGRREHSAQMGLDVVAYLKTL